MAYKIGSGLVCQVVGFCLVKFFLFLTVSECRSKKKSDAWLQDFLGRAEVDALISRKGRFGIKTLPTAPVDRIVAVGTRTLATRQAPASSRI